MPHGQQFTNNIDVIFMTIHITTTTTITSVDFVPYEKVSTFLTNKKWVDLPKAVGPF